MTHEFQCSNVYAECEEVIKGETEDEVMAEVATHMREHHGMIELPSEMAKWVLASANPER